MVSPSAETEFDPAAKAVDQNKIKVSQPNLFPGNDSVSDVDGEDETDINNLALSAAFKTDSSTVVLMKAEGSTESPVAQLAEIANEQSTKLSQTNTEKDGFTELNHSGSSLMLTEQVEITTVSSSQQMPTSDVQMDIADTDGSSTVSPSSNKSVVKISTVSAVPCMANGISGCETSTDVNDETTAGTFLEKSLVTEYNDIDDHTETLSTAVDILHQTVRGELSRGFESVDLPEDHFTTSLNTDMSTTETSHTPKENVNVEQSTEQTDSKVITAASYSDAGDISVETRTTQELLSRSDTMNLQGESYKTFLHTIKETKQHVDEKVLNDTNQFENTNMSSAVTEPSKTVKNELVTNSQTFSSDSNIQDLSQSARHSVASQLNFDTSTQLVVTDTFQSQVTSPRLVCQCSSQHVSVSHLPAGFHLYPGILFLFLFVHAKYICKVLLLLGKKKEFASLVFERISNRKILFFFFGAFFSSPE